MGKLYKVEFDALGWHEVIVMLEDYMRYLEKDLLKAREKEEWDAVKLYGDLYSEAKKYYDIIYKKIQEQGWTWIGLRHGEHISQRAGPTPEVKRWMKTALGIEDYKGDRGDQIHVLRNLVYGRDVGKVTSRSDKYKMAEALAKGLGYHLTGYKDSRAISWEREIAEQIANETGKEVYIIEGSVIIKPETKSGEHIT